MPPSMDESLAIPDLADLYEYLSGNPHPFANPEILFPGVAAKLGLGGYWPGGSEGPTIAFLLTAVITHDRGRFCDLILGVVTTARI